MLSEAELQKKWESLTFTDDFYLVLFSTICTYRPLFRRTLRYTASIPPYTVS